MRSHQMIPIQAHISNVAILNIPNVNCPKCLQMAQALGIWITKSPSLLQSLVLAHT